MPGPVTGESPGSRCSRTSPEHEPTHPISQSHPDGCSQGPRPAHLSWRAHPAPDHPPMTSSASASEHAGFVGGRRTLRGSETPGRCTRRRPHAAAEPGAHQQIRRNPTARCPRATASAGSRHGLTTTGRQCSPRALGCGSDDHPKPIGLRTRDSSETWIGPDIADLRASPPTGARFDAPGPRQVRIRPRWDVVAVEGVHSRSPEQPMGLGMG